MTPTETERHELRKGLSEVLPEAQVKTLMDSLPPVDWRELATKTDLAALEERLDLKSDARFAKIDARFTETNARFAKIDARFEGVDARFERVDARFERVDAEFKVVHAKFERVEARIDKRAAQMLVGVAVLLTPLYLALFAGFGG
ncbi:MAG: hypothetical protein OXG69_16210 [bacterium]|nr:hypothetical protein [bacterium]